MTSRAIARIMEIAPVIIATILERSVIQAHKAPVLQNVVGERCHRLPVDLGCAAILHRPPDALGVEPSGLIAKVLSQRSAKPSFCLSPVTLSIVALSAAKPSRLELV